VLCQDPKCCVVLSLWDERQSQRSRSPILNLLATGWCLQSHLIVAPPKKAQTAVVLCSSRFCESSPAAVVHGTCLYELVHFRTQEAAAAAAAAATAEDGTRRLQPIATGQFTALLEALDQVIHVVMSTLRGR